MSITSSKNAKISQILGVDFGKAKIGLAVADSETRIAFCYGVLKNDKDFLEKIAEIVKKEGINKIILGDSSLISSPPAKEGIRGVVFSARLKPLRPSGTSPWQGRKFGEALSKKLNIPIEFQNELYSTQQAERNLKEKGVKRIKRFDDQEAARIILQSWLDKKG
jgi:putative holliday junction resolvase